MPMSHHQRTQTRLLAALAVLTVIGLYIAGKFQPEDATGTAILSGVEPSTVMGVAITTTTHQIAIAKEGSEWQLQLPITAPADQERVDAIVGELSTMTAHPVNGMDPSQANIGLLRMEVDVQEGPPRVLLFGRQSPVGDGRYVSVDSVVHLTTGPLPRALLKPGTELRSTRPVSVGMVEIHSIEIAGRRVDEAALEPLVEALMDLRIADLSTAEDLSGHGVEVVLKSSKGDALQTLKFVMGDPWLLQTAAGSVPLSQELETWNAQHTGWFDAARILTPAAERAPHQ